jgi:polar amino acid transport system substrate-binding protein
VHPAPVALRQGIEGGTMHKGRKLLALLLALMLAVAVLGIAGCASKSSDSSSTSTDTTATKVTTVESGKLLIGSDTAFPPFESMNGSTAEGFDVDLAQAIADELGLEMVFQSETFDTLIPTLKAGGKFDLIMSGMTITDERKQEIDFSDPYIDSNQSIAVQADSAIASSKDLSGKTIGVQSGTTGEAWAKENVKDAKKLVPYSDTLSAFAALQAGQVDAVVNDLPVSAAIVKDTTRGLKIIEEIPTGEQYGIGVSKDNPDLLKAVNDALASMKSAGKYDEIYTKWFGQAPN